jgi:hypothetical protein
MAGRNSKGKIGVLIEDHHRAEKRMINSIIRILIFWSAR